MNSFTTVKEHYTCSFTERRSEFISDIFPVGSKEEAEEIIESIRAANRKASHVVNAIVLANGYTKYTDAGEPYNTAGKPVFEVITANKLTNVLLTVTRYFGGVLLGTGGLTRAYSTAAALAVKAAVKQTFIRCIPMTITLSYTLYGRAQAFLASQNNIRVSEPVFTNEVAIDIKIPTDFRDSFLRTLTNLLNANFTFVEYDQIFEDFS
jgi:uncharacterized YigZ family protein